MSATKQRKPAKAKRPNLPVKDMEPEKDAEGGAQKKETPEMNRTGAPFSQ